MEGELQNLRSKQKLKLEELKEKNDYYRTLKIIERFDKKAKNTKTLESPLSHNNANSNNSKSSLNTTPTVALKTSLLAIEPNNKNPNNIVVPRRWMDRVIDHLLGEEEASIRYALICIKCYAHNGLSLVPSIPFSCKNCHFVNNRPNDSDLNKNKHVTEERGKKNIFENDATPIAEFKGGVRK